ncbi:MAG: PLDc N-terminal domain-containing protein [Desulforhopalus sp.]
MDLQVSGIFGLLVLIADIWAIISVVQSRATTGSKVLWVVLVLLLPVLGLILWLLFGPRQVKG